MQPLLQPEGSELCGQTCVAMIAGVSLKRGIEAVGHGRATWTRDIVRGLNALGIECAGRLRCMGRAKPVYPKRGVLAVCRPMGSRRPARAHWMVIWDGVIHDPGGCWPDRYPGWRITSYLEIF